MEHVYRARRLVASLTIVLKYVKCATISPNLWLSVVLCDPSTTNPVTKAVLLSTVKPIARCLLHSSCPACSHVRWPKCQTRLICGQARGHEAELTNVPGGPCDQLCWLFEDSHVRWQSRVPTLVFWCTADSSTTSPPQNCEHDGPRPLSETGPSYFTFPAVSVSLPRSTFVRGPFLMFFASHTYARFPRRPTPPPEAVEEVSSSARPATSPSCTRSPTSPAPPGMAGRR